jgi:hypothetical protein
MHSRIVPGVRDSPEAPPFKSQMHSACMPREEILIFGRAKPFSANLLGEAFARSLARSYVRSLFICLFVCLSVASAGFFRAPRLSPVSVNDTRSAEQHILFPIMGDKYTRFTQILIARSFGFFRL